MMACLSVWLRFCDAGSEGPSTGATSIAEKVETPIVTFARLNEIGLTPATPGFATSIERAPVSRRHLVKQLFAASPKLESLDCFVRQLAGQIEGTMENRDHVRENAGLQMGVLFRIATNASRVRFLTEICRGELPNV